LRATISSADSFGCAAYAAVPSISSEHTPSFSKCVLILLSPSTSRLHYQAVDPHLSDHDTDAVTRLDDAAFVGKHHPVRFALLRCDGLTQRPHLLHHRHLQNGMHPFIEHLRRSR